MASLELERIRISSKQIEQIREEAERNLPQEACALLLGRVEDGIAVVERILIFENIYRSPTRFRIRDEEVYRVYLEAEEENMEIVGIFHSHPGPARPSPIDEEYMTLNPVAWLILSTIDDRLAAFQKWESEIHALEVEVTEEDPF